MIKPRLIYLSQLFDPEPTFKGSDFVDRISANGFEVEVVTGFPNYPGGQIYPGYRIRAFQKQQIGSAKITRLAMYPSHDRSALRRMATYLSFMCSAFIYLTFFMRRVDLVYVYYPALTAGLAAVAVKLFRRMPVILDVQDMWPDSLGSSGLLSHPVALWLAHKACNLLYRCCDHIIVLSPGFKALLIARGVSPDKITVIFNWAQESSPQQHHNLPTGFHQNDGFRVLFAGNIGEAQQLDTVLDAARTLQVRHPGCGFYVMGDGVQRERLMARARAEQLANVHFLPRVPLPQVQAYLAAADALLVHLADDPLFRITVPSKTQAYLFAGRPILMGVDGDAADLIRRADAGYVFRSGDAGDLAQCVCDLISDGPQKRHTMGLNGHTFYQAFLSRDRGIRQTVQILQRCLPCRQQFPADLPFSA